MRMVWTVSNNPMDWLIKLVTAEDCCHFAFVFDSPGGGGVVFESNLLGAHPAFYKTWLAKHTIIHEITIKLTVEQEDALWDKWVNEFDGKPYDFLAILYLGWAKLKFRFFGIPIPKVNKWGSANAYFCDEAYQLVSGLPGFAAICPNSNGMDSPHDVFMKVSQNGLRPS